MVRGGEWEYVEELTPGKTTSHLNDAKVVVIIFMETVLKLKSIYSIME